MTKTATTDATPQDKDPLDDIVGVTHCKPQPTVLEEEKKNPKIRKKEKKKEKKKEDDDDYYYYNDNNNNNNLNIKKEYHVPKYHYNGLFAEAVIIAGKPYFAIAAQKIGNPDETSISLQKTLPLDENTTLKLLEAISYIDKPYSFKSEEEFQQFIKKAKTQTLDTLYTNAKSIWSKYIDADDFHISICAADTIYTYYQDKIGLTHYLFFVGNNSSGKSNNLRVLQYLAYRNMTSTDITAANIYQFLGSLEEGGGTICEDEADNIDDDKDKMRIYKNGYTTGYPVLRTDTSKERKQLRLNTFCFKAFAAERTPDSLKAKGFNQRIIELSCVYGFPQYDISEVVNPAGEEEYQELLNELTETRNLLLVYRLLHYKDKIPDVKLNIENREKQLFKPLIRVFQNTETLEKLLPIISKYVRQKRESNANSLIAFLYRTIWDLIQAQNTTKLESGLIWNTITESLQGNTIPNKPQSYESVEFGYLSQKDIIQILKDIFGAKKSKRHGEGRKLEFDKVKLEKLGKIYDLDINVEVNKKEEADEEKKKEQEVASTAVGGGTHGTHSDLDGQPKEEQSEHDGTLGTHGTLLGAEQSNTNIEEEVKPGGNQVEEGDDQSPNNNNSIKNELIIENDSRLTTTTTEVQSMVVVKEEDVKSQLPLSNVQSNSAPDINNASQASHVSQRPNTSVENGHALNSNSIDVSQASQMGLTNTSKKGEKEVAEKDIKEKEEEDLQQHNNTNNARTIIEQKSQMIPPPPPPSSCAPPQDNHIIESQSISLDDAISLLALPARKRETSDLWNRIPPFSSIKVVVDTSQIKHIDDGSNDNTFWQIFDELQSQSPDKKTVNGHKLKARLVSSNKFFVGDAVLIIERMEQTARIRSVGFDEYQKRW